MNPKSPNKSVIKLVPEGLQEPFSRGLVAEEAEKRATTKRMTVFHRIKNFCSAIGIDHIIFPQAKLARGGGGGGGGGGGTWGGERKIGEGD